MRYIKECTIILGLTMIGEWLNYAVPLPVPAGVYGLFLMLFLLCTGIIKLSDVEATGNLILDIMPVLFIPSSVALLDNYGTMKVILIPLVVICVVSTIAVMATSGKVTELIISSQNRSRKKQKEEKKS